jgi:hypothetical protein
MRRFPFRWFLCGLLVGPFVGMLILPCLDLLLSEPSRITRANFDRIELGMTKAEVDAIIGSKRTVWLICAMEDLRDGRRARVYTEDSGSSLLPKAAITVEFNESERVIDKRYHAVTLRKTWNRVWFRIVG